MNELEMRAEFVERHGLRENPAVMKRVAGYLELKTNDELEALRPEDLRKVFGAEEMDALFYMASSPHDDGPRNLMAVARSGDPRALDVLAIGLAHCVDSAPGYLHLVAISIAALRHPRSAEVLLSALHDEHLDHYRWRNSYRWLGEVVRALGTLGAPAALLRLAQIASTRRNLALPAVEAIGAILDRSMLHCTAEQLRAIQSMPDHVIDLSIEKDFDPASDERPQYVDKEGRVDCTGVKARAAAELRARGEPAAARS